MITSTSNPRVKWVRALQRARKSRDAEGVFVIEGQRLMREALDSAIRPHMVMHTGGLTQQGRDLIDYMSRRGAEVMPVSEAVMAACSDLDTPPGVLAVLEKPVLSPPERIDLALIIDGLSDPGNLGTILRTALAVGAQIVYLTKGTVDPFNPKVVRGGMGAQLHLPLCDLDPSVGEAALGELEVRLADPRDGVRYDRVDWSAPTALAIGGEAQGVSPAVRDLASETVHIPLRGRVESLNAAVAAAVILFEILRQRGVA